MDAERAMRIQQLKEKIARHEYVVDERVLAEAIVARITGSAGSRVVERQHPQSEPPALPRSLDRST
jgi:hypothetical protein